jgi:hypothetical protein
LLRTLPSFCCDEQSMLVKGAITAWLPEYVLKTSLQLSSGRDGYASQGPRIAANQPASRRQSRTLSCKVSAVPHISLIASDVDGTLLNSKQQLDPVVEQSVLQAAAAGVPVRVPACLYPQTLQYLLM